MVQQRRGQPIPRNQGGRTAQQGTVPVRPRRESGSPIRNRIPQVQANAPSELSPGMILLLILLSPVILLALFVVLGILVAAGAALGG